MSSPKADASGNNCKASAVKFSSYNKKSFLKTIKEATSSAECRKRLSRIKRKRYSVESVREYINEQAATCQKRVSHVMEKEGNATFLNLNDWAQSLVRTSADEHRVELPLAIEMISKADIPNSQDTNGIDLPKLYDTLAKVMAGFPVDELDKASKSFLSECYKELFDKVYLEDVSQLQSWIDSAPEGSTNPCPHHNLKNFDELIRHSAINPLNVPVNSINE